MNNLQEFRRILSQYAFSSRSHEVRLELCGLIEDMYKLQVIDRDEYHSSMAYIA